MRRTLALALCLAAALLAPLAAARSGSFDYFLLALSWSPSWCAAEGDAREAAICAPGEGRGFTLHGLWPQHEQGWPEWCESQVPEPSARQSEAMEDIMGAAGLARHQWRKHGRCTGLDPAGYFALSRRAFEGLSLDLPASRARMTPTELASQIRALNPGLPENGLIVTCREGLVMEVRLCLTRGLRFRDCAPDVLARSCRGEGRLDLPPPR